MIKTEVTGNETTIYLYGRIGKGYEITDTEFQTALDGVTTDIVNVRVNSPGGSVFEGSAIYNALKAFKGTVNTYIDGAALSMASIIVLAGQKVYMAANAVYMIHNPHSQVSGDAIQMRKEADALDKIGSTLIAVYKERTGMDEAALQELLNNETWFSASEALEAGFIDEIINQVLTNDVAACYNPKSSFVGMEDVLKILGLTTGTSLMQLTEYLTTHMQQLNELKLSLGAATTFDLQQLKGIADGITTFIKQLASQLKLSQDATQKDILDAVDKLQKIITGDEATDEAIEQIVQEAVYIKKISTVDMAQYRKLLKMDFKGTKAVLTATKPPEKPSAIIANGHSSGAPHVLRTLDDYRKYNPAALRKDPALYERLYNEQYGN